MKKFKVFTLGMCLVIAFAGCNNLQKGTAIGAGGGALLGTLIGVWAGNAALGAAIGTAIGAGAGALIGNHMDKIAKEAAQIKNAKVEKLKDANGLDAIKVSFDSGLLFATGKYDLNSTVKSNLQQFAGVLTRNDDCDVAIYGHTDNSGFGSKYTAEQNAEKNLVLSQERAESVKAYLQSCGVNQEQVKYTKGFGQTSPVASNETAEGKQQNRRVEVYLYASEKMINEANAGTLN